MNKLMTVKEAAQYLGISCSTLNHWRLDGRGPCYVKMREAKSAAVRYREADLAAFVASRLKGETRTDG